MNQLSPFEGRRPGEGVYAYSTVLGFWEWFWEHVLAMEKAKAR
jgi:hypothetical protein